MKKIHPLIYFVSAAIFIAAIVFAVYYHNHRQKKENLFPDFKHAGLSVVCNKLNQFAVRVYASGDSFFIVGENDRNSSDGFDWKNNIYYVNKFIISKSDEYHFTYYDEARQMIFDFLKSFQIEDSIKKVVEANVHTADSIDKLSHDYSGACFVNDSNRSLHGGTLLKLINMAEKDTAIIIGDSAGYVKYDLEPVSAVPVPVFLLISERWATDAHKTFWKDTSMFVANVYAMRAFKIDTIYYDEYMRKLNMHNFIIWQEAVRYGDRGVQKLKKKMKFYKVIDFGLRSDTSITIKDNHGKINIK